MTRGEIIKIHEIFGARDKHGFVHCDLCPYGLDEDHICLVRELLKDEGVIGEEDEKE